MMLTQSGALILLQALLTTSVTSHAVASLSPESGFQADSSRSRDHDVAPWQPAVGATWQIVLLGKISENTSLNVDIFNIDLFDNDASIISTLHDKGRKVICYFSASSYEDWRPDESKFKKSDIGNPLAGWDGKSWLNLRSENVRDIMTSHLNLAVEKGCDGVNPDNINSYDNDNGIDLTADDMIDFVNFLANEAHARGLSIGLKNAGAIIPDIIDRMEWCVNEQCVEFGECDVFAAFIEVGKPVFHLEYPKGEEVNDDKPVPEETVESTCGDADAAGFSTLIKNMNLDTWLQTCKTSQAWLHGPMSMFWLVCFAAVTLALSGAV